MKIEIGFVWSHLIKKICPTALSVIRGLETDKAWAEAFDPEPHRKDGTKGVF